MSYEEIAVSYPKARKEYDCEWCPEKILKGEKHFARTYKFCGDFQNGRMHLECEKGMNKSAHDIVSEGWLPGEFKRGEIVK